jgi:hypothetical protein
MVAVSRVELDENVVHLRGAAGMEPKASSARGCAVPRGGEEAEASEWRRG